MGHLVDLYIQYFWLKVEIFKYTWPLIVVCAVILANSAIRKRSGWK